MRTNPFRPARTSTWTFKDTNTPKPVVILQTRQNGYVHALSAQDARAVADQLHDAADQLEAGQEERV